MSGKDLVVFLKQYIGSPYVFGAIVPKKVPGYVGAFDCAEFVTYGVGQVYGIFGYGTRNGDAFTGYMSQDAAKYGKKIPVDVAARIPGAILMRDPKPGAIGHTAVSQGNGQTIEAYNTKKGVKEDVVTGRRWDYGYLLNGVDYEEKQPVKTIPPAVTFRLKSPMMKDPFIEVLQKALKAKGFYNEPKTDQYFGPKLNDAVVKFQRANGLIVDGEIEPGGETAKALNI